MKQETQIQMRLDQRRLEAKGFLIRPPRLYWRFVLEPHGPFEPGSRGLALGRRHAPAPRERGQRAERLAVKVEKKLP